LQKISNSNTAKQMKFWQLLPTAILLNYLGLLTIDIHAVRANPLQCYQVALPTFASSTTANIVVGLCQGATSTIPGECFSTALPKHFPSDLAVKRSAMVCKGATSIAPGECFNQTSGTFATDESIERAFQLCKPRENLPLSRNDSNPQNHHSRVGVHGVWHVARENWSGLLRMYGNWGVLTFVHLKTGDIVEEKMELSSDESQKYILTGKVSVTNIKKYVPKRLYLSEFSTDKMSGKTCGSVNRECFDLTFTYLDK
jgi:hypothetical protein